MRRVNATARAAATLILALAAAPSFAQGNSQGKGNGNSNPNASHGNGNGNGKPNGNGHGTVPPSRSVLPPPSSSVGGIEPAAAPFALIDDASVLPERSVWVGLSTVRWSGAGASEVDVPVVNLAVGLTPRVQLSASIPRVAGSSDPAGAAGGIGTMFVSGKVALARSTWPIKLAVAPTLEILSGAAFDAAAPGGSRARWGLPVSVGVDRGRTALYAGAGYFSGGIWFAGGGASYALTRRLAVSASFSRATVSPVDTVIDPTLDPSLARPGASRTDVGAGASYALTSRVAAFGSVGHTIATADENGAGMTIAGGLSLTFVAPRLTQP